MVPQSKIAPQLLSAERLRATARHISPKVAVFTPSQQSRAFPAGFSPSSKTSASTISSHGKTLLEFCSTCPSVVSGWEFGSE